MQSAIVCVTLRRAQPKTPNEPGQSVIAERALAAAGACPARCSSDAASWVALRHSVKNSHATAGLPASA